MKKPLSIITIFLILFLPLFLKAQIIIDVVKDYGIKADGVTDNSAALNKIAADYKNRPELIELVFPNGLVTYADNTWRSGLYRSRIICKTGQTTFRCTGFNGWYVSRSPFNTGGMLTYGTKTFTGGYINQGFLFSTVQAGSTTLTFSLEDVKNFTPGQRIFLEGYEAQGQGWPINPRHFEWNKVTAVDKATGRVTLRNPLSKSFNAKWKDYLFPDGTNIYAGKPRVHIIKDEWPSYAEFTNVKMSVVPGQETAFFLPADTLICNYVDFTEVNVWPTENHFVQYNYCNGGGWEIDKCIGKMEYLNSTCSGLWGATGIDTLIVKNSVLTGSSPMTPHKAWFENVSFGYNVGGASLYEFKWWTHTDSIFLKNCTFSQPYDEMKKYDMTVVDVVNGNIVLPDGASWDAPENFFQKLIGQGSSIWSKDGTSSATVKDIIYENGKHVLLLTNLKGSIIKGSVWQYRQTDYIGPVIEQIPLPPVALPVKFLYFKADCGELSWGTADEINVSKFVVEKNESGVWNSLADVAPHGSGDYTYQVNTTGKATYRVKEVDRSGKVTYSTTASVNCNGKKNTKLSPNPATTFITLSEAGNKKVFIHNNVGQLVRQTDAKNGRVNLMGLSPGFYIINIFGQEGGYKFLKQ